LLLTASLSPPKLMLTIADANLIITTIDSFSPPLAVPLNQLLSQQQIQ